ncbi:hypothetical protein [Aquibium sp. ELW1220]|uniref:hypothetical protein n=1 Tax=Aquibium sp. ELW1220 TaxID=2976766 RepID=UPI0025B022BC|nr:hypothetical protein [Aquibium sp. ELW1220]MDN2582965.1 hypothetical protein [Aquibium sp. ELW1220]
MIDGSAREDTGGPGIGTRLAPRDSPNDSNEGAASTINLIDWEADGNFSAYSFRQTTGGIKVEFALSGFFGEKAKAIKASLHKELDKLVLLSVSA